MLTGPETLSVTGADPRPIEDWLENARAGFTGPPPDTPLPPF